MKYVDVTRVPVPTEFIRTGYPVGHAVAASARSGFGSARDRTRLRWCFHGVVGVALKSFDSYQGLTRYIEMAHRAIVGKICPDANFEGVDGAPGCTLRSLGDGKRTIVLEWYGHH